VLISYSLDTILKLVKLFVLFLLLFVTLID
jgi:hypothetical protein